MALMHDHYVSQKNFGVCVLSKIKTVDLTVVGSGLVGLTAGLALAKSGFETAVIAPEATSKDKRTTALLQDSVDFLDSIGLWKPLENRSHPLKIMRIVDGTNRLFRMQTGEFHASELGLEAFGYNIRNADMLKMLSEEITKQENLLLINGKLVSIEQPESNMLSISFHDNESQNHRINCSFIVGADGRNSPVRTHFGHGERRWSYPQTAIVLDFEHDISSSFASTEFHNETGPFTIVPRSNKIAGLVWLEEPSRAEQISAMNADELNDLLERQMSSFLGKINVLTQAQTFPMSGLIAKQFGDESHALLGEAAHVFPPIGAQGFNLGIRDVEALVEVMRRYTSTENRGERYHRARFADVSARTAGVDALNRSLLTDALPIQVIRGLGMAALQNIPLLRKQVMKFGISPRLG